MAERISTSVSTMMNPFGPQWSGGAQKAEQPKRVGEQIQDALFGKKKPSALDPDGFPDVRDILAMLNRYRKKFAIMAGDKEDDYRVQLADGTIAMIDGQGTIFMGLRFILKFKTIPEVLLGALAHEVGHRPQRWEEYKARKDLNHEELYALCRYEETRADLFMGRAMAEMELNIDPIIQFLEDIEEGPHPEYFPAHLRAEVIRQGWSEQKSRAQRRKKLWPNLDRMTSPKWHLGDY